MKADVFPVVSSLHPKSEGSNDQKYIYVRRPANEGKNYK